MRQAVLVHLEAATILIKAREVADFHVVKCRRRRVKKTAARGVFGTGPEPDFLAELGRQGRTADNRVRGRKLRI
jgi:hypothetical protein